MPNVRLLSSIVAEIYLIQFSLVVLKGPSNCSNHAVGPEGEISRDELESSRQGSRLEGLQDGRMEVIFVADQIPEERQWALILVAGGDEAYNRWDTLEDTVQDRKKVEAGMGRIREELRTINFILAFQRHLSGRLQAGRVRDNGQPGSSHQADCQGVPMAKGSPKRSE